MQMAAAAKQIFTPILDNKKFKLLGWTGIPGMLDIVHDTHVPEFAWEHLVG